MTTETVPLGAGTIAYGYDAGTWRTQMQVTGHTAVTYAYGDANWPTSAIQGANAVRFEKDVASRRVRAIPRTR